MAERLHPGVYIEEVSSGVRPIEAVGTSTAAFVGVAARGRPGTAHFLTSYDDYVRELGGALPGPAGYLGLAVDAFFKAGGRRAYAVRVLPAGAEVGLSAPIPAAFTPTGAERPFALFFRARAAGEWSRALRINVTASTRFPGQAFNVEVLSLETGVPRRLELFEDLRMDPAAETYVVEVVRTGSRYVEAIDLLAADRDADEPEHVPIPEEVPSIPLAAPTDRGATANPRYTYRIRRNARLAFRVTVPGQATPTTRNVVFSDDAVLAALALEFDDDDTLTISRAQLATLLGAQLGTDDFHVDAPNAPEAPLAIQARVATRALAVLSPLAGSNTFDLSGKTLNLTVTVAAGTAAVRTIYAPPADPANPPAIPADPTKVTAHELVQLAHTALAADATVTVEQRGESVVVRAARDAGGVTLVFGLAAGDLAATAGVFARAGLAGRVVDSLDATELTISEQRDPLHPSTMRELGLAARARGYEESSPANPLALPAAQDRLRIDGGSDGPANATLTVTDYVGVREQHTGLHALDEVDVNMVALPGQNTPEYLAALMTYADGRGDCFAILDGPGSPDRRYEADALEARQFVDGLPNRSKNAAMYYPWLQIADPTGVGKNPVRMVPPAGHIAGIFARTDLTRGVWKAPAGLEAVVNEALDLQSKVIDADQDILNPFSLNCVRQFPGAGIVVWGSRTLSSDPEWRYVPVRRTALFIEESLRRGLKWAVFEPNDQPLWDQIRTNIKAFMMGLFRQGAFQGGTPDDAFRVTCDRSTNPQERVDAGIVTARVEFAPLKPAEFVVIEISQKSLVTG